MNDINGVEIEIGMKVYDISIPFTRELPHIIETISGNKIRLSNGKLLECKDLATLKGILILMNKQVVSNPYDSKNYLQVKFGRELTYTYFKALSLIYLLYGLKDRDEVHPKLKFWIFKKHLVIIFRYLSFFHCFSN